MTGFDRRVKGRLVARLERPIARLIGLFDRLSGRHRAWKAVFTRLTTGDGRGLKIAVVRLDSIGDVLLSEPAIRALRRRFPAAELHLVADPAGAALLEGHPALDRIWVVKVPWHRAWRGERLNWLRSAVELLRGVCRLRKEGFDAAVELRGDPRDILFMWLLGPKLRVGSDARGGGSWLHVSLGPDQPVHRVEFAQAVVGLIGARPVGGGPQIPLRPEEVAFGRDLVAGRVGRPRVAFHLGAGFATKRLPVPKFAAAARGLHQLYPEMVIYLVGGPEEAGLAARFMEAYDGPVINLVGRLSLRQTAALLREMDLFIGNDSAPMHFAAAAGVPVVTFFGPSEPAKYHPYGTEYRLLEIDLPCRPCDHVHCRHIENYCLSLIPVRRIVQAAAELLGKPARVGQRTGRAP